MDARTPDNTQKASLLAAILNLLARGFLTLLTFWMVQETGHWLIWTAFFVNCILTVFWLVMTAVKVGKVTWT